MQDPPKRWKVVEPTRPPVHRRWPEPARLQRAPASAPPSVRPRVAGSGFLSDAPAGRDALLGAVIGLCLGLLLWVPLGGPMYFIRLVMGSPSIGFGWQDIVVFAAVAVLMFFLRRRAAAGMRRLMAHAPRILRPHGTAIVAAASMTLAWAGVFFTAPLQWGLLPHIMFPALATAVIALGPHLAPFTTQALPAWWRRQGLAIRITALVLLSLLLGLALGAIGRPGLERQILVLVSIMAGFFLMAGLGQAKKQTTAPTAIAAAVFIAVCMALAPSASAVHDRSDVGAVVVGLEASAEAMQRAGMPPTGPAPLEEGLAMSFHAVGYIGIGDPQFGAAMVADARQSALSNGPGGYGAAIQQIIQGNEYDWQCTQGPVRTGTLDGATVSRGSFECPEEFYPGGVAYGGWTASVAESHQLFTAALVGSDSASAAAAMADDIVAAALGGLAACGVGESTPSGECSPTTRPEELGLPPDAFDEIPAGVAEQDTGASDAGQLGAPGDGAFPLPDDVDGFVDDVLDGIQGWVAAQAPPVANATADATAGLVGAAVAASGFILPPEDRAGRGGRSGRSDDDDGAEPHVPEEATWDDVLAEVDAARAATPGWDGMTPEEQNQAVADHMRVSGFGEQFGGTPAVEDVDWAIGALGPDTVAGAESAPAPAPQPDGSSFVEPGPDPTPGLDDAIAAEVDLFGGLGPSEGAVAADTGPAAGTESASADPADAPPAADDAGPTEGAPTADELRTRAQEIAGRLAALRGEEAPALDQTDFTATFGSGDEAWAADVAAALDERERQVAAAEAAQQAAADRLAGATDLLDELTGRSRGEFPEDDWVNPASEPSSDAEQGATNDQVRAEIEGRLAAARAGTTDPLAVDEALRASAQDAMDPVDRAEAESGDAAAAARVLADVEAALDEAGAPDPAGAARVAGLMDDLVGDMEPGGGLSAADREYAYLEAMRLAERDGVDLSSAETQFTPPQMGDETDDEFEARVHRDIAHREQQLANARAEHEARVAAESAQQRAAEEARQEEATGRRDAEMRDLAGMADEMVREAAGRDEIRQAARDFEDVRDGGDTPAREAAESRLNEAYSEEVHRGEVNPSTARDILREEHAAANAERTEHAPEDAASGDASDNHRQGEAESAGDEGAADET